MSESEESFSSTEAEGLGLELLVDGAAEGLTLIAGVTVVSA